MSLHSQFIYQIQKSYQKYNIALLPQYVFLTDCPSQDNSPQQIIEIGLGRVYVRRLKPYTVDNTYLRNSSD